ncbi:MAG: hypothetical protein A2W01_08910 [Candidatus Solincola sediminis]|uniref:Uncharacterized protein n=1 Tax=Candidatus Solincola sediminis TaxID=1797199 RepID=A0A1F2WRF8_9ACTN|nr:MAG: hypothetical protein A2Y75_11150 [Candidatus Solincola sediminis]OFW60244.1 MAG: hypothetical protein A2W01_08910 [Candidatus Solincola sediminis]
MELQPEQLFDFMEVAWRHGVIDELMPLVGKSLKRLKANSGLTMDDLLNKLDGAKAPTIEKFNKVLGWSPPLLRIASNDILMSFLAKMLRVQAVRSLAVWGIEKYLARALAKTEGTPPKLAGKLKGLRAKGGDKEALTSSRAVV